MSRITGSEVASLMEAYSAVYAPQELTEEQIWEEVENWVNSLLEEGYDLSDYTWEEMYEAYIEEKGMDVFSTPAIKRGQVNQALSVFNPQKPKPDAITSFTNSPAVQKAQKDKEVRAAQDLFGIKQKSVPPTTDKGNGGGGRGSGSPTRDVIVQAAKGGVAGSLNKTTGKWTASGSAPAAPKVSPSTPAKPAGPAMGKLGGTTFVRRTPTSAELKAAQAARETQKAAGQDTSSVANAEKALQAAKAASAPKVAPTPARSGFGVSSAPIAAKASVANVTAPEVKATNTIAAAPKLPSVAPTRAPIRQMQTQSYEYDAYDVVLEYLLSEGHVETVEEAHYVMMEMDAEMVQDIVEAKHSYSAEKARAGEDIGKPGKQFEKIAAEAGERYGSEERGKKVAGAVLAKLRAKNK